MTCEYLKNPELDKINNKINNKSHLENSRRSKTT